MFEILILTGILIVSVILFFPVSLRFFFSVIQNERFLEIRIFRKKIYRMESGGEKSSSEDFFPVENSDETEKDTPENLSEAEYEDHLEFEQELGAVESKNSENENDFEMENLKSETEPKKKQKKKSKKKKRKLTEREFLTLVLQPHFERLVLKKGKNLLKSFFRIFRAEFERTVVEGIHFDYSAMGLGQGLFGAFSAMVPLFKNWELHMDWTKTQKLGIRGSVLVRMNGIRILNFLIRSSFFAGWLFFRYRKDRKKIIENPGLFKLIFWRRWILNLIATESKNA